MIRDLGTIVASLLAASAAVSAQQPAARLLSSQGMPAEHVALLMSDQEGGDLLFEQVVSVVPVADGTVAAGLWLEVDADSLLLERVPERLFLKLTIYALRGSSIVASRSRAVEVTTPASLLEVDGVRIHGAIQLEPGDYRLRVLVSEPDSDRVGIREDAITIPAGSATAISALALSGVDARWLDVALDGPSLPPGFFPSALAVLPTTSEWSAQVLVRGSQQVEIENGSSLGPEGLIAADWSFSSGQGDWQTATTRLRPAAGLSGRFEVAPVAVTAGDARRTNIGGDFVVQQRGEADLLRGGVTEVLVTAQVTQATSWTRLKSNTEVDRAVDVTTSPNVGKKLTMSKREARKRLLDELSGFAAGDPAAVDRLAAFESEATGGSASALATLSALELRTYSSIQQRQPEAVVPILALYLERYRSHLERGEYFLSTHCKRMAIALADQAAAEGDPGLQPVLADFLAAMGGLQVAANDPGGVVSLRSALDLQPQHPEALEILAWHLERDGQYEELEKAVGEVDSMPPQVLLRQALAGVRLRRPDAVSRVEALSERPDWVGRVASQALVQRRLDAHDYPGAKQAVDGALARFPDDRKLILLAAIIHDLEGRPVESLETMAMIEPGRNEGVRHRYARDPDETINRIRLRISERAEADAAALEEALKRLT